MNCALRRLSISGGWGPRDVTAAQPTLLQGVSSVGSCSGVLPLLQNIIFFLLLASKSASSPRSNCVWVLRDVIMKWVGWLECQSARSACCGLDFWCMHADVDRSHSKVAPQLAEQQPHAPHFRTPRCQHQQLQGIMTWFRNFSFTF